MTLADFDLTMTRDIAYSQAIRRSAPKNSPDSNPAAGALSLNHLEVAMSVDRELQVSISSDEPSLCVEVILRGQGYSPDVATDIKRRAVDAFRDAAIFLTDLNVDPDDIEDEGFDPSVVVIDATTETDL